MSHLLPNDSVKRRLVFKVLALTLLTAVVALAPWGPSPTLAATPCDNCDANLSACFEFCFSSVPADRIDACLGRCFNRYTRCISTCIP